MLITNWFSSACIVLAVHAGSLYVNTTISMVLSRGVKAKLPVGVSFFNQAHDAYLHLNETTRQLDLSFPLTTNHFVGNNNRVRLKCLASISNFYWKSTEIILLQERPKFASVMKNGQEESVAEKSGKASLEILLTMPELRFCSALSYCR